MDSPGGESAAKGKWKMLRNVVMKKATAQIPSCSVRTHNDLRLFRVNDVQTTSTSVNVWKEFCFGDDSCQEKEFSVLVKNPAYALTMQDLRAGDNTGNVCIWASEQAMANYCIANLELFHDKAVIELGGGYTCLAGLFVAKYGNAKRIVLSDGNYKAQDNVSDIVAKNSLDEADVMQLCWDNKSTLNTLAQQFDYVLCADCLFRDAHTEMLSNALFQLLNPNGKALIFAPRRGKTFDLFLSHAQLIFGELNIDILRNYDDKIWQFYQSMTKCDSFDEDIHYPLLIRLTKIAKSEHIADADCA